MRPPLERIRTRKPWVLFRFRLFGWYVRFMAQVPRVRNRNPAGFPKVSDKAVSLRNAIPRCQTAAPCGTARERVRSDDPHVARLVSGGPAVLA